MNNEKEKLGNLFLVAFILITLVGILSFKFGLVTGINTPKSDFKNINKDGSFVLKLNLNSKTENDKILVAKDFTNDEENLKRQFEWYTDPLCGDCIRTHHNAHEFILKEVKLGNLEIKFHPLNYLPHRSENNYSLTSSAWLVGVAEESPNHITDFMYSLYDKEFRDVNKNKEGLNHQLYHLAIEKAKIDKQTANSILKNIEIYENAVNRGSVGIRKFEKWKEISPKEDGSFFVPFIYNSKTGKALLGEEEDTETHVIGPLIGSVDCNVECD